MASYRAFYKVFISVDFDSDNLTLAEIEDAYEHGRWVFHDHEIVEINDEYNNAIDPTTLGEGDE